MTLFTLSLACFFISEDQLQRRLSSDDATKDSASGPACDVSPDADGDGYDDIACGGEDCDDTARKVFPGAGESCNGMDDDCDDVIDDSASCPCPVEHYEGSTYQFCPFADTWENAAAACDVTGYHLVEINDAGENSTIYNLISVAAPTKPWWIGFSDQATEGVWVWEGAGVSRYTNWAAKEPSNDAGSTDCAEINGYYPTYKETWNDTYCDYSAYYICEVE